MSPIILGVLVVVVVLGIMYALRRRNRLNSQN